MNRRKILKDYHTLAKGRGFKWLGNDLPQTTNIKTVWKCSRGHQWQATYNKIQQRRGCPHCYGNAPKVPTDYHALAKEHCFKWLGSGQLTTRTKTNWECKKGHQWQAPYRCIQQGCGCPYCAGKNPKTAVDYYTLAKQHGFKWLGLKVPMNVETKTGWECSIGHRWEAMYNKIQQGRGCPYCAGKAQKISTDYHTLAQNRGFKWLGPEVGKVKIKTKWRCSKDHVWAANYNSIQQGTGCPFCVDRVNGMKVSGQQRQLCKMLAGELNYPCDSYRIDIALLDEMIAIEYDCWFWHGYKQEHDAKRDLDLLASGWKILHVKSNDKLPTLGQMRIALDLLRNGESITEIVLDDWGIGPTFADRH